MKITHDCDVFMQCVSSDNDVNIIMASQELINNKKDVHENSSKMSITKNAHELARLKAQTRILQWVEETKSAGITRLHDRYGTAFKRIEYKRKDASRKIKELKNAESKKDKSNGKSKVEQTANDNISPDTNKVLERRRSRQTPDSRKWMQRDNRSSHNRSSRAGFTSICSIEAVSLLCDDETGKDGESSFRLDHVLEGKIPRKFKHDKDSIRIIRGAAKFKPKTYKTFQKKVIDNCENVKETVPSDVQENDIDRTIKRIRRQSVFRRKQKRKEPPKENDGESRPFYVITSSEGVELKRSSITPVQRHAHSRSGFLPQLNEIGVSDTELPTSMRTASSLAIGTEHSEDIANRPISATNLTHVR